MQKERVISRRYRNRRIGDFLKELDLTEGRSTGIPKIREAMAHNGSPPARLITDEERTFFRIELPIHPAFVAVEDVVEDVVEDLVKTTGALNDTERAVLRQLQGQPLSMAELVAKLGYWTITGNVRKALQRLQELGLLVLTIPEKPRSKNQKRRLTERGRKILAAMDSSGGVP